MARAPERDEDFRDFVEAHWLGLVRSAYLLVGEHDTAEDLVEQTLAGVAPHWHRRLSEGAPLAYVHDAMVQRAINALRRRKVQEILFGAEGPGDEGTTVVAALGDLPPRVRAVVVLLHVDDLSEAATADVLGMSLRSVRRAASRGLERLHAAIEAGALAPRHAGAQQVLAGEYPSLGIGPGRDDGSAPSTPIGDDIRRALLVATRRLSVPPDAYARVMTSAGVRRHRRVSAVAAAGIASLVLAGIAGLAAGVTPDGTRGISPAPVRTVERPQETDAVIGPELDWAVRGELGTDPAFAAEFDRAFGADHRLLYAENAEAGQVAIAISARGESAVFHGPSDASVEDLERFAGLSAGTRDITVAVPVSGGHLVIALMPQDVRYAQISLPTVTGDGAIQRSWRQMPVEAGVARLVTTDPVGAVRLRTPLGDGGIHVVAGPFRQPGTMDCGDCAESWVTDEGPARFRDEAAAVFGVPSEVVTSRLILDATVPAAGGRIVSFVARRETGGLLRATYVIADPGGGNSTMWMVEPLRPLPGRDPVRPFIFTSQPSGDLVIVAPDASRISFGPIGEAPPLPDVRLTDGIGFLTELPPDFASYRIFAHAQDGSLSSSWHGSVLTLDDPLDVRYHLGTRRS